MRGLLGLICLITTAYQSIQTQDDAATDKSQEVFNKRLEILNKIQDVHLTNAVSLNQSLDDLNKNIQEVLQRIKLETSAICQPKQILKHVTNYIKSQDTGSIAPNPESSIPPTGNVKKDPKNTPTQTESTQPRENTDGKRTRTIEKESGTKELTTIQVFHSHDGKTIQQIKDKFALELKKRCGYVVLKDCKQHTDIKPSQKLIVLSIVTSRVGTDAESAIKHIKNPANTALVLVNLAGDHNRSIQKDTANLKTQKLEALDGIFELAFSAETGIYTCDMNEDALTGICKYIMEKTEQSSPVD